MVAEIQMPLLDLLRTPQEPNATTLQRYQL